MRKIIVFNIISLDGYHTGPDNDPSVMFPMMGGVFDTYNAELLRAAAYQQIAELKRQPGKDILITGSRTLWNDLLAHDLVDEIHLMIGNMVLGEGIPAFVGKTPASLRLVEVRNWKDSDNILVRYEVRHTSA